MFRVANGFKGSYHDLDLMVAADFDEWKVLVRGPGVCIHGGRQFSEDKAKAHAVACATDYYREFKPETPKLETVDWQPMRQGEWLNWRP